MKNIQKLLKWFDGFQQKHNFLGFPIAVFRKYSDDQAGNQAALITYFGFVSLFPLLLVLFTVMRVLSVHNNAAEQDVVNAVLHYFPGAAQEIYNNVHSFQRTGFSLVVVIVTTIYGTRGIANAMQNASNKLWQIPKNERPDFLHSLGRSVAMIIFGGIGVITTTLIISYVNNVSDKEFGFKALITVLTYILNSLIFLLVFRLATASKIPTKSLIVGAAVAGFFWQVLQALGSYLILHQLRRTSELYGVFAITLGMLFWIYIQAEVTLYAIEINVVRIKKLWPRSLL